MSTSDDTERALGAPGAETVTIAGKECTPRPLGARELAEVHRICLDDFKRQYLKTYTDNFDLLPRKKRDAMLAEEFRRVARWIVEDLPKRTAHNPDRIALTPKLKKRVTEAFGLNGEARDDESYRTLAVGALDEGLIDADEYATIAGEPPPAVKVGYVNWWITGCFDGMVALVWVGFKDSGVTRDEIAAEFGKNRAMISELARNIEGLSAAAVGNG